MILGISGSKQAGKNTTANILHGIVLQEQDMVNDWNINSDGNLMVDTKDSGWGEFDITRQDEQFKEWAEHNMWPHVKIYSFADHLKWICVKLFDIPFECCFGTDEQKNQVQEHLLWENMPGIYTGWDQGLHDYVTYHEPGPMTAREFMQFFGTDIMRKVYEPIWVNACIKKIQQEQSELAIIADVRFPNEAKAIEQAGGRVVRLTRKPFDDDHSSEVALDDYPFKDYVDNKAGSVDDLMAKVKQLYNHLKERHASNLC